MTSARTSVLVGDAQRATLLTTLATVVVALALLTGCGGGAQTSAETPAKASTETLPTDAETPAEALCTDGAPWGEAAAGAAPRAGAGRVYADLDDSAAAGADELEAARTVALYCHLVEAGQFARAGDLCGARRLWSRRAFRGLRRFHFRSARVYAAPDARTLVLKARVRVHAGRGCPLPDGLAVVFFTLGRVGSAVGGWLITAVSTGP